MKKQDIESTENSCPHDNESERKRFIVMWHDPNNSVTRKGGVEYNGKKIFDSFEEATIALKEDRAEEFDCNPNSQITYEILRVK